jgi:lipid II:glycine glycyltransferase (peptidoglycan interpeptide bridge formation enzyme)
MLLRPIRPEEKTAYNQAVDHPLQSWEWGEFRAQTDVKVERLGLFDQGELKRGIQVTFHPIPLIGKTAGYFPKGYMPDQEQLAALEQLGKQHNALFIKMEPNIAQALDTPSGHGQVAKYLMENGAVAGRPLFTKYTFQLDLTPSEDKLFANLDSKTRYNVNLAYKKGVTIVEDTSAEGMEIYLDILQETTQRQGFYAHTPDYFRTMWQTIGQSGLLKIFHAVYQDTIITSWIMFEFNGVLYYPYGASRSIHRNVMANNLMMWEMIRYGQTKGLKMFDMWGSLGPEADPKDSWYGFHKFKRGYGGQLVEFVGTYDIVMEPTVYKVFRVADELRWKVLRLKSALRL